ncbi:secreted protein [Melampsora americana]|nr:secreted protein [Melampsora americana]
MFFSTQTIIFFNMILLLNLFLNTNQIQSQSPGYNVVCCDKVNDICGGPIKDLKCREENSNRTFPYTCQTDQAKPQCLKGGNLNQQVCVNFGQLTCQQIKK